MFSFFSKKSNSSEYLSADIHSHLLPNLDDGVKSFEESLEVILQLQELGYKKLITTPHINSDSYPNDVTGITTRLLELQSFIASKNVSIKLEAAAEYYLDAWLINQANKNLPLMTFGDNYLLFEMNFMTEPFQLYDFIFTVISQGYKPVLAHPERYHFMTMKKAEEIYQRGVLFQINILSFINFYNKSAGALANHLVDNGWVNFLGSDCHRVQQSSLMREAFQSKYFKKALHLPLLNKSL